MMIEKRLAQWYAADAGVDLDIAEREIALTYLLRILADQGLLARMAFKEKPRIILSTTLLTRYLLPDGVPAQAGNLPCQPG
jgi:hypothetical protein